MLAKLDLDERIATAFRTELHSDEIASLLEEAILADERAQADSDLARERALDPATPPADVTAARKVMEDCAFRRDRLGIAARRLDELLDGARKREREAALEADRHWIETERDALAAELQSRYPALADELGNLLNRLALNNAKVELFAGMRNAEQIARDSDAVRGIGPIHVPSLTQCRIVEFTTGVVAWTWSAGQTGPAYRRFDAQNDAASSTYTAPKFYRG